MNRLTRSVFLSVVAMVAPMLSSLAEGQQANSYAETRIGQFERSVNELRARLEQLRQQNQHLQQELDRMRSNHESRLQRLENGSAKAPPAKSRIAKP